MTIQQALEETPPPRFPPPLRRTEACEEIDRILASFLQDNQPPRLDFHGPSQVVTAKPEVTAREIDVLRQCLADTRQALTERQDRMEASLCWAWGLAVVACTTSSLIVGAIIGAAVG